jgi:hypothetical protein
VESFFHGDIIHPTHCFCQIPPHELKEWAFKKYRKNISTVDLLKSTDDPHEKEVICIVSLLDVDEKKLFEMMGDVNMPEHHLIHCREDTRKLLSEELKKE